MGRGLFRALFFVSNCRIYESAKE